MKAVRIDARQGFEWSELWHYRDLLRVLALKEVSLRYKQTVLGASWAFIKPFCAMIVFSVFLGKLAHVPSDGAPYPVFVYAALIPWNYFADALARISESMVTNRQLITKVYFPRLILPLAPLFTGLVDLGVALITLIGLCLYYGIVPGLAVLTLPFFVVLAMMTALSLGLWLSALNAHYRDFQAVVPFLVQIWLFSTPVVYPSSMVPLQYRALYGLNPMASVVEGFRWALLGQGNGPGPMLWVSLACVTVLLIGGLMFFRSMERNIVDVV